MTLKLTPARDVDQDTTLDELWGRSFVILASSSKTGETRTHSLDFPRKDGSKRSYIEGAAMSFSLSTFLDDDSTRVYEVR
jgi:hypothetical protein|nr:MAG TPA: hypothetical protein [Caudoviricetes sp.]